jgi:hypothetical protein
MTVRVEEEIWVLSERLTVLKPVFEELGKVHQEYINRVIDDSPYWYRERAHIGFLAAAIGRGGGITLEEYGTKKNKQGRPKQDEPKHGRCDLYIQFEQAEFQCEAKCVRLLNHVRDKFREAVNDTRALVHDSNEKRLALLFFTPTIHESKFDRYYQDDLPKWKTELTKQCRGCDAMIWIGVRDWQDAPRDSRKHIHANLLLVAKVV